MLTAILRPASNPTPSLSVPMLDRSPMAAISSLNLPFHVGLPFQFSSKRPITATRSPPNRNSRIPKTSRPKRTLLTNAAFSLHPTPPPSLHSALRLVGDFDPRIPIEDAVTPPSSWYTDPSFYPLELDRVFYRGWQAVGYTDQVKEARDYFTGRLGSVEYIVCRDGDGKLRAFHNVCRHHASVLSDGSGQKSCFVCPYHGWTYGLDGALLKATRITGQQKFDSKEFGLEPIDVAIWGPFFVINLNKGHQPKIEADDESVGHDWLGTCSDILRAGRVDSSLSYVCRREYTINCNWKVFCDNYLDGGYHVPYAHRGLASNLELNTYTTEDISTFLSRFSGMGPGWIPILYFRLDPGNARWCLTIFLMPH